jgi:hypothetical protein
MGTNVCHRDAVCPVIPSNLCSWTPRKKNQWKVRLVSSRNKGWGCRDVNYRLLNSPLIMFCFKTFALKNRRIWNWECCSRSLHLPSVCKAVGSIPSTKRNNQTKDLNLLVFVQHAEGVKEGKIGSYTFKVLLGDVPIMVVIIVSKHRLQRKDKYLLRDDLWVRLHTCYSSMLFYILPITKALVTYCPFYQGT